MLYRIEVDVGDVRREVRLIADQVLPIPALPDAPLAPGDARLRPPLLRGEAPRECGLDVAPSRRVVGIIGRQSPDAMQMFGQDHDRHDAEGARTPRFAKRLTQGHDVPDQQRLLPLQQIHGEEAGCPRDPDASIVRHGRSMVAVAESYSHSTPRRLVGIRRHRRPTRTAVAPAYGSRCAGRGLPNRHGLRLCIVFGGSSRPAGASREPVGRVLSCRSRNRAWSVTNRRVKTRPTRWSWSAPKTARHRQRKPRPCSAALPVRG